MVDMNRVLLTLVASTKPKANVRSRTDFIGLDARLIVVMTAKYGPGFEIRAFAGVDRLNATRGEGEVVLSLPRMPVARMCLHDKRAPGHPVLTIDADPARSYAEQVNHPSAGIHFQERGAAIEFSLAVRTAISVDISKHVFLRGAVYADQRTRPDTTRINWGDDQLAFRWNTELDGGNDAVQRPRWGLGEVVSSPVDTRKPEYWSADWQNSRSFRQETGLSGLDLKGFDSTPKKGRPNQRTHLLKTLCYPGDWSGGDYIRGGDRQSPNVRCDIVAGPNLPKLPSVPTYELQFRRRAMMRQGVPLSSIFPLDSHDDLSNQECWLVQRQPPYIGAEPIERDIPWILALEGLHENVVKSVWNRLVDRYHQSIATARADRPISMVPELRSKNAKDGLFSLLFSMRIGSNVSLALQRLEPGYLESLWLPEPLATQGQINDGAAELRLFSTTAVTGDARASVQLQLSVSVDSIKAAKSEADKSKADDQKTRDRVWSILDPGPASVRRLSVDSSQYSSRNEDLALIDLKIKSANVAAPPPSDLKLDRVRLGAYELLFSQNAKVEEGGISFIRLFSNRREFPIVGLSQRLPSLVESDVHYELPLADLKPASQDRVPDDPADALQPLLVLLPEPVPPERQEAPLRLVITEAAGFRPQVAADEVRQNVRLEVKSSGTKLPKSSLIVLDSEPFFIAKIKLPDLTPEKGHVLATWDSDGREGPYWRLTADRSGYEILLPPQAVGESMIKSRSSARGGSGDPQGSDGAYADFRFGSHARLNVFTHWRESRVGFTEPPFNTRRIFGFASQRAPGAPLIDAEFEMLYGLVTKIEGNSDRLVTELAAELGLLPPVLHPERKPDWPNPYQLVSDNAKPGQGKSLEALLVKIRDDQRREWENFKKHWSRDTQAFRRRLAVLMVQDKITGVAKPLSQNVGFELRSKALIRPPVPLKKNTKAPFEHWSEADRATKLLDGGATWGFESSEIYDAVWKKPTSEDGEVSNVHLSALGAWGNQRALFDERKSAIISNTGQGRTHYYTIERIGRIGVFWNRAKHVIVYERSVRRSDQFEHSQPAHEGRPFLRKVAEYVELLEPERQFPEDRIDPVRRGCVEACVFRSKKINVDSAWGSDIPDRGWKVPLWNPFANSTIYPKPQIELRLAGDAEGDGLAGPLNVAIAEPDNLVFFTSTVARGDNTDAWPAEYGIDYVVQKTRDIPPPQAPTPTPGTISWSGDRTLASDRAVPPGFGPVTFVLDRQSARAANLVAERVAGSAITAVLETVTMMRPAPGRVLGSGVDGGQLLRRIDAGLMQLRDTVRAELGDRLDQTNPGEVDARLRRLETEIERVASALGDPLGEVRKEINKVEEVLSSVSGAGLCSKMEAAALQQLTHGVRRLDKLQADALALFSKERTELFDQVGSELIRRQGDLSKAQPFVTAQVTRLQELLAAIEKQLLSTIATISSPVEAIKNLSLDGRADKDSGAIIWVGKQVQEWSALANRIVDGLEQQASTSAGRAAQLLIDAARGLEDEYESASGRVSRSFQRIGQAGATVPDTALLTARHELKSKVVTPLLEAAAKCSNVAQPATLITNAAKAARTEITTLSKKFNAEIVAELTKRSSNLGKAIAQLSPAFALTAVVKDFFNGIRTKADGPIKQLTSFGDRPIGELQSKVEELKKLLEAELGSLNATYFENRVKVDGLDKTLSAAIDKICMTVGLDEHVDVVRTKLLAGQAWVENLLGDGSKIDVRGAIAALKLPNFPNPKDITPKDLLAGAEALLDRMTSGLGRFEEALIRDFPSSNGMLEGFSPGLRLVRAFGDAPRLPMLDFNRRQLAYFFDEARRGVDTTPVTMLFDRVGNGLKGFGLRVPTSEMLDKIVPKFKNPPLSDIFPDIAGLKLENLFPNLTLPDQANDRIRVKHGLDKQSLRAWVDAEIQPLQIVKSAPLFSLAGLSISLQEGKLSGRARLEANDKGQVERTAQGTITGNWEAAFGGKALITFVDSPLSFDSPGRMKFDLRPDKVKLAPELDFLEKFLRQSSAFGLGGGLTIGLLREGVMPVGVECILDLPVPDMTQGAFGISGLRFIAGLEIRAMPKFSITLHASLGAPTTPFTLTILILGGSGWVQLRGRYTPEDGGLAASVSIAMGVSATIGFNFGPINGIVQLFVGINALMEASNTSGGRLSLSQIMSARGQVNVAGLISVGLFLMLEMRIEDGSSVIGEGTAAFAFRIGPFFKYRISQHVTYQLKSSRGSNREDRVARSAAASAHANSLQ